MGDEVCEGGNDNTSDDAGKEAIAEYYRCQDSDVRIHTDLVCDGIHQCPNKDDEDPNDCHEIYSQSKLTNHNFFRKRITTPLGTYRCVTADVHTYPNLTILAVICDGKVECLGSEDEQYCDITELIVGILFCLAFAPCVAVIVVWFCRDGNKRNALSTKIYCYLI